MRTVAFTYETGLCCSCGVCRGVCPKNCISFQRKDGMFLPVIDEAACVECGLCAAVCPGLGHTYEPKKTAQETITGEYLACFNAWSKDAALRHVCASGGVITTMIQSLLKQGMYDGAFCLDSYDYRQQLKTRLFTAADGENWADSKAPKSRYLPVSQEDAVRHILRHPDEKLIIVGTSCALRGIEAVIRKKGRSRENYLLIGLFCDKVFNYNVLSYFENTYAGGAKLTALHFKNKESGGWPGDMKFFPENAEAFYVPLEERGKAKAWFSAERCHYCVDKLNICADISLGDNYTGKDASSLGSNSVIVRTERGKSAWMAAQELLTAVAVDITDIQAAQDLAWRLNNLCYGDLKCRKNGVDLNSGVPREQNAMDYERAYHGLLNKLECGSCYDKQPEKLRRMQHKSNPNPVVEFSKRCYYFLRRKLLSAPK